MYTFLFVVFQSMDRQEDLYLYNNMNYGCSGQIGIPNNNIPVSLI